MSFLRACWPALAVVAMLACSSNSNSSSPPTGDYDDHDDLNKTVISCEEAYARLEACCPGFDATRAGGCIDRNFRSGSGCDSDDDSTTTAHQTPALSMAESLCIRALPCDALNAQHICDRAQKAPEREVGDVSTSIDDGEDEKSGPINIDHPPVCP